MQMIGKLQHSLDWAAVPDSLISQLDISLPDPYEPILVLYERGGMYRKVDGFLIMVSENLGFSQGKWQDFDRPTPYIELDKASLDKVDLEWEGRGQIG